MKRLQAATFMDVDNSKWPRHIWCS